MRERSRGRGMGEGEAQGEGCGITWRGAAGARRAEVDRKDGLGRGPRSQLRGDQPQGRAIRAVLEVRLRSMGGKDGFVWRRVMGGNGDGRARTHLARKQLIDGHDVAEEARPLVRRSDVGHGGEEGPVATEVRDEFVVAPPPPRKVKQLRRHERVHDDIHVVVWELLVERRRPRHVGREAFPVVLVDDALR